MATATSTPNYIVGKAVAVVAAGKLAYCTDGTVARSAALVKVTNARSGGYQQMKAGVKSATATINCVYNGDDPPVGIVEGAEITLVVDTLGNATELAWKNASSTPHGRFLEILLVIGSITDKWNNEQDYTWTFEGQSTGQYTVNDWSTDATATTGEVTTVTPPTEPED